MVVVVVDAPRVVNRDAGLVVLRSDVRFEDSLGVNQAINYPETINKQNSINSLISNSKLFVSVAKQQCRKLPYVHVPAGTPRLPASRDRRLTLKISVRRDRASLRTPLRARPFAGIGALVCRVWGVNSNPTTAIHWHRHTHATARWTWLDGWIYVYLDIITHTYIRGGGWDCGRIIPLSLIFTSSFFNMYGVPEPESSQGEKRG